MGVRGEEWEVHCNRGRGQRYVEWERSQDVEW